MGWILQLRTLSATDWEVIGVIEPAKLSMLNFISKLKKYFQILRFFVLKNSENGNTDSKKARGREPLIQVKVFDHEHEKDLEKDMNHFLKKIDETKLVDIKYNVAAIHEEDEDEQIYCFSAMVIYRA